MSAGQANMVVTANNISNKTRMSELKKKIQDAVVSSMKAGDKERLAVVRLISSAMKQVEVDERIELDDSRVIAILDKMVKQRRESISQFKTAGRDDLVEKESYEIDVIQEFLPQALSEEEVDNIVKQAIEQTGAESIKDMGKVMGLVRPQIIGRADMGEVSGRISSLRVEKLAPDLASGLAMDIQTSDRGLVHVHCGPLGLLDRQEADLKPGDHVTVKVFCTQLAGREYLVAGEIKHSGHTLVLQDAQGTPYWEISRR